MNRLPRNEILTGDARTVLARLPRASADCVVTSPPYFRLRNYQHPDQIGLETGIDGWVNELRLVLAGLARVLKPTGSMWLNLGDSYSRHSQAGAPPKSLLLGPERLALAMIEDGWTIRNKIVWAKPNPMPASVGDRLATTWEVIYFATRSRRYFFDLDAIRIPHRTRSTAVRRAITKRPQGRPDWAGPLAGSNGGLGRMKAAGRSGHLLGKNPGDVWNFATSNFRGAHFATFPIRLLDRPLRATCPERVCERCGTPHQRRAARVGSTRLIPTCTCRAGWKPGVVLDPFLGSGTTAVAANALGRDWVGIELNPDFVDLANQRIAEASSSEATTAADINS